MTVLAIVGSRTYPVLTDVDELIAEVQPTTKILSGYARGVDRRATEMARVRGLEADDVPAAWSNGKGGVDHNAGFFRNSTLVRRADFVVGFWDGVSNGTLDTLAKALHHEKLYMVVIRRGVDTPRESLTALQFQTQYAARLAEARARSERRGCWLPKTEAPTEVGAIGRL
jgi:hypothetical protein